MSNKYLEILQNREEQSLLLMADSYGTKSTKFKHGVVESAFLTLQSQPSGELT